VRISEDYVSIGSTTGTDELSPMSRRRSLQHASLPASMFAAVGVKPGWINADGTAASAATSRFSGDYCCFCVVMMLRIDGSLSARFHTPTAATIGTNAFSRASKSLER
jgi:hypothetical protein